jgi:hypothetical protein
LPRLILRPKIRKFLPIVMKPSSVRQVDLKPGRLTRSTQNSGEIWLFFIFFNFLINLKTIKLIYEYVVSHIFFFITYIHILFLNFQYGITIYSQLLHGLFLNFLMITFFFIAYIHMNYFLISLMWDNYTKLYTFCYSLYPYTLFLNFSM